MKKSGNVKQWVANQLFKLFKKELVSLFYLGLKPSKSLPQDRLTFAFFGASGKQYFQVDELPILRKLKIAQTYIYLVNAINDTDINASIDAILLALQNKDDKGKMQPDIAKIGFICQKLKQRKGYYVRMDLIHELMANYFIREDETYDMVDNIILAEKIEEMSKLPHEVVSDFFYSKSVNELFPYLQETETILSDVAKETSIETNAFLNYITDGRR